MNAESATLLERSGEAMVVRSPVPPAERPGSGTLWLWAGTLFGSALLLFAVQPMVARMLLPQLGGTPTVWNTCIVFFQALLLGGYAYSHFIANRFSLRTQWLVHGALLLLALLTLPIALPESLRGPTPWEAHPVWWLLKHLFLMVGLPFFIISSTGPLLQNWFSRTNHPSARDPYFLYGASNLGSLIALLAYPLLLEPAFRLKQQSGLWTAAYGVFLVLFAACALTLRKASPRVAAQPALRPGPVGWSRRLFWVLLAFVPSSLMLGVTTYLTTDIASVPLLWIIPLALYLLSFILAFARKKWLPRSVLSKALPITVVALLFLLLTDTRNPAWLLVGLHLLFFFLAAVLCHTRLADDRPGAEHLTQFYLWLSVGGALGGAFNALLAPVVFNTVAEYPLIIVLACMVSARLEGRTVWLDWMLPGALGAATAALALWAPQLKLGAPQLTMLIVFGLPLLGCYFLSKRPVRFALGLGAVVLAAQYYTAVHGRTLHAERNFFGAIRVTLDPEKPLRRFYHGTTVHGCQFIDPSRRREPQAYYHRTGPFGIAYHAFAAHASNGRVAAIGLGVGGVSAYATAGQQWTFYEIDPAVLSIASNTNFFSYLADCTNAVLEYKLGDARLRLREAPPASYALMICDAFSSDVPPLHLMTREAMDLYLSKLAPHGMLLFHISSRYLDFGPVLAGLANSLGLQALEYNEAAVAREAMQSGKYPSRWVALARDPKDLGKLASDRRWTPLPARAGMRVWTDDYSNLLSILDWR